jgi:hypothetical protein
VSVRLEGMINGNVMLPATGRITHLATWALLVNRTRCGLEFPAGTKQAETDVDCMACVAYADAYEIPLSGLTINAFNEHCYFKQVLGQPYGHVTECCYEENPCRHHK